MNTKGCIRCHDNAAEDGKEYCGSCRREREAWENIGIKNDGTETVRCYRCGGTFPHGAQARRTHRGMTHATMQACLEAQRTQNCRPDDKVREDVLKSAATSLSVLPLHMLTILFVGLKLGGVIGWSWWWVTAPSWAPIAIVILGGAGLLFVSLLLALYAKRKK